MITPKFDNVLTKNFVDRIKQHEGFSGVPYKDSLGRTTIGYGRCTDTNPITKDEAEFLLYQDLVKARSSAGAFSFYSNLSPKRRQVLIEMIFQLGFGGVRKFRKMLDSLERADYKSAASEMINSIWYRQTPERCQKLADIIADDNCSYSTT